MIGADILLPACLALIGIASGLLWRVPRIGKLDALALQRINKPRLPGPGDRVLGILRVAGTTPFFIAALVLAALARPSWALGLGLAAVGAEAITKALKIVVRRPRPLSADSSVVVRLPRLPLDASFPSGDAMRAAFLSGLTIAGRVVPLWVTCLAVLVSVLVGLGRIRSGAHYPLDVWAGWWLGLGASLVWAGWPQLLP